MEQRSRLLGLSDRECLVSPFLADEKGKDGNYPPELAKYLTDSVFLTEPWHNKEFFQSPDEEEPQSTWRNKDRLKTAAVVLVLCLNIGTDPPESPKPTLCARKECWIDPIPQTKQKSLENIGNALQKQYEKWQPKAKFKPCLDPSPEELHKACSSLRKTSKSDRLLLHYNGHGAPRPTKNGELWVFGKNYTHYMPIPVSELRVWLGDPAVYVLDCNGAGALIPHLIDALAPAFDNPFQDQSAAMNPSAQSNGVDHPIILLAACKSHETLPVSPLYPADIFTSCLTTPIQISLRWFILQVF